VQASDSLQGAVPPDSCHDCVINGAWNGVEDDVKDHQQDDQSEPDSLFLLTVHGKTSFRAGDAFLLIRSIPQGFTL
jgi:hypothetical protein